MPFLSAVGRIACCVLIVRLFYSVQHHLCAMLCEVRRSMNALTSRSSSERCVTRVILEGGIVNSGAVVVHRRAKVYLRISQVRATDCLNDIRPKCLVPECAAVNAVHCQFVEHWSHYCRDVWKQQQLRSAFELFVGEERRQSSVQDAIGSFNPLTSCYVFWLVASTSPGVWFER